MRSEIVSVLDHFWYGLLVFRPPVGCLIDAHWVVQFYDSYMYTYLLNLAY